MLSHSILKSYTMPFQYHNIPLTHFGRKSCVTFIGLYHCLPFCLFYNFFKRFIKCPSFGPILEDREMQARGFKRWCFWHPPFNKIIRDAAKLFLVIVGLFSLEQSEMISYGNVYPSFCAHMMECFAFYSIIYNADVRFLKMHWVGV